MFAPGTIVRAVEWPGTHGERYVVREIVEQPRSGEVAWVLTLQGGTPFGWRAIPTTNLREVRKGVRRR